MSGVGPNHAADQLGSPCAGFGTPGGPRVDQAPNLALQALQPTSLDVSHQGVQALEAGVEGARPDAGPGHDGLHGQGGGPILRENELRGGHDSIVGSAPAALRRLAHAAPDLVGHANAVWAIGVPLSGLGHIWNCNYNSTLILG